MHFKASLLTFLLPGFCSIATAQPCTLRGYVLDDESGNPLQSVNVFLANTTTGTSTDASGAFVLVNVPSGDYTIVVSMVGYQRQTRETSLLPAAKLELTFRLRRKELKTEEVQVYAPDQSEWKHLLGQFSKVFLGQTDNAGGCSIENPYQLELYYDDARSVLTARCDSPLIVENRSLGYLLTIEIEQFEWDARHERVRYDLYPRLRELGGTSEDSATWNLQRQKTYRGSLRHFLKSAVDKKLAEEQFTLYTGRIEELCEGGGVFMSAEKLTITPDSLPGVFRLAFRGWIRVAYRTNSQVSRNLLTLHAPYIRIDRDGNVLTRYGVETGGSWSRCGVADLLPMH